MADREQYTYMATLAEQTERFIDMIDYMKKLIAMNPDLKDEERNLLSIAYKNSVGAKRTAWRAITAYEMKEMNKNSKYVNTVTFYKKKIEQELQQQCQEVLNLLETKLIGANNTIDSTAFYLKMKGDYNRYLAEFTKGDIQLKAIQDAETAYIAAKKKLDAEGVQKINALRLGIVLNTAVFYYDIKNDLDQAIQIANNAFQEANNDLNNEDDFDLEDNVYKDVTTILQLLKDNLTAWTVEQNEEKEKEKEKNKK